MDLRQYQVEAIERIRQVIRTTGKKRIILQAACGAGKTIISADIVSSAIQKGKRVLFLINRRDLVKQTVQKFEDYGIGDEVGIIMAGEEPALGKPVQVASIQTYGRRIKLVDGNGVATWMHSADLVIFDEAHSSIAQTYKKILDLYKKDSVILGLTATPCRSDGRGLGEIFQEIIPCIGIADLIKQGFLVPMVHYGPSTPDLSKIRTVAGDYDNKQLGGVMDVPKLVGDIYENWLKLAGDRQTVIFAVNVKHSKHIRDHFLARGISIDHIDANTPDEDREGIYKRFESGDTQVLTNVGICTEGSDFPSVSCIVLARPTKSYGRYIQMAGRGLRPFTGKKECILLDHSGCVDAHGFVDDEMVWTLDDKARAWKEKKPRKKEKKILTCEMCAHCFTGPRCPRCGNEVKGYGKKIEAVDAELIELGKHRKKATTDEKRRFYGMAEYTRRLKGYAPGWSAHFFKSKFGTWPNAYKDQGPIEPDQAFRNYLTYQVIRWRKMREKDDAMKRGIQMSMEGMR